MQYYDLGCFRKMHEVYYWFEIWGLPRKTIIKKDKVDRLLLSYIHERNHDHSLSKSLTTRCPEQAEAESDVMSKRQEDLYFIRIMDGGGRPKDWRTSQKPENYNICGLRKGQSLASTENKEAQIKKKCRIKWCYDAGCRRSIMNAGASTCSSLRPLYYVLINAVNKMQ